MATPQARARTLTPDEQARALEKLRVLERAAMFTSDDSRVTALVTEWSFAVRTGSLGLDDVAAIAAEFDRWGVSHCGPERLAARPVYQGRPESYRTTTSVREAIRSPDVNR